MQHIEGHNENIIALLEPEIPSNTGNIARTCVLTGTALHLIKPLGFSLDDKYLKRAGLDYWPELDLTVWESFADFSLFMEEKAAAGMEIIYATTKAKQDMGERDCQNPTLIVFGKETKGIDESILQQHPERCLRIPMKDYGRSLNLANSVNILLYDVLRQQNYPGLK